MEIRIISSSDIDRCLRRSLEAGHYRDDGTCLCFGWCWRGHQVLIGLPACPDCGARLSWE